MNRRLLAAAATTMVAGALIAGCSSSASTSSASSTPSTAVSETASADADTGLRENTDVAAEAAAVLTDVNSDTLPTVEAAEWENAYGDFLSGLYANQGDRAVKFESTASGTGGDQQVTMIINPDRTLVSTVDGAVYDGKKQAVLQACDTAACYISNDDGESWQQAGPVDQWLNALTSKNDIIKSLQQMTAGKDVSYLSDGTTLALSIGKDGTSGALVVTKNGDTVKIVSALPAAYSEGTVEYTKSVSLPDNLPSAEPSAQPSADQ